MLDEHREGQCNAEDFVLDAVNLEKFRTNIQELRKEVSREGQKALRSKIVQNFKTDGLRLNGTAVTCFGGVKSILSSQDMAHLYKKHWKLPFWLTARNVYSCEYGNHIWLYPKIRAWANKRAKCPFDFERAVRDKDYKEHSHNIMRIANSNHKTVYKPIQEIENRMFGMSCRSTQAATEEGYLLFPVRFSGHDMPGNRVMYLKVDISRHPTMEVYGGENHIRTEADLSSLGHSVVDYSAYTLAHVAISNKIKMEDVVKKLKKTFQDIDRGNLVGPSPPQEPGENARIIEGLSEGGGWMPHIMNRLDLRRWNNLVLGRWNNLDCHCWFQRLRHSYHRQIYNQKWLFANLCTV